MSIAPNINTVPTILRKAFTSIIVVLYPYLVYQGIQVGIVWLAPTVLASLLLYQAYATQALQTKIIKAICALVLLLGVLFFQNITAKLLPTLIQLFLLQFFASTLKQGPPLIERFVRLEFDELPEGIVEYCRQLTLLWSGFFAINAVICSVLAIWASPELWAIYTGIMIFVLTALLMLAEYIYRHYRFPDMLIPDIKTTARNMLMYSRQIWQDVQGK